MPKQASSLSTWKDDYITGIKVMDEDHRQLFRLLDKSLVELENDRNWNVGAWQKEFNRYAAQHFLLEESLMEESLPDWPERAGHLREHRWYWEWVMGMHTRQDREEVASFLRSWWSRHVLVWDKRLGQALRALPPRIESR